MPSDYGTRTLPSRAYPVERERVPRPLATPGGARGAVGYPGAVAEDRPAPADFRSVKGASGQLAETTNLAIGRYGIYPKWFNGGDNPPTWYLKWVFYKSVRWARGWYDNSFATSHYQPPVDQPNWTANTPAYVSRATSPLHTFRKWIGTWSIKEDYHQDAQRFLPPGATGSPPQIVTSATLKRMRSPITPRIQGGRPQNLSRWGRAPSYGSTTAVLRTAPSSGADSYGGTY